MKIFCTACMCERPAERLRGPRHLTGSGKEKSKPRKNDTVRWWNRCLSCGMRYEALGPCAGQVRREQRELERRFGQTTLF